MLRQQNIRRIEFHSVFYATKQFAVKITTQVGNNICHVQAYVGGGVCGHV